MRADDHEDGVTVFCLSTVHQHDLVDAAIALGLAARSADPSRLVLAAPAGRELTLPQWRTEQPADFDRACGAVVQAVGPAALQSKGGLVDSVAGVTLPLIPVLLGAVLTAGVSQWLDARTRGRASAEALTVAVTAFTEDMRRFVGDRTANRGTPADVMQKMRAARVAAERLVARGPHRRTAQRLRGQLTTSPLDDTCTEGWLNDDPGLAERAKQVGERLADAEATADFLATALSTPGRPHPVLWLADRGGRS